MNTVEPRLADTPEMETSTVYNATLCTVLNISYVYKTTPEIKMPF